MTKDEFLLSRINELTEIFEKYGSCPTTFAVLYNDGTVNSFGTSFSGQNSKDGFDFFMQRICENPEVIASVFTSEAWTSSLARIENKHPSECSDRETIICVLYSSRDNIQEMHCYKPGINGKLELLTISKTFEGRFSNPFNIVKVMTKTEKELAINEFQTTICDSLCRAYDKFHQMFYMLYFLNNTEQEVSVSRITDEEWRDKARLKQRIETKCREPLTVAFILAIPTDNMVNVILEADDIQDVFCYRINPLTHTLEFESRGTYDGEFSGFFNNGNDLPKNE